MKLKDKFSQKLPFYNVNDNNKKSIECQEIAEDFAMGFAEWCDKTTTQLAKGEWSNWLHNAENSLSSKELLQIFKKEKGL